MPIDYRSNLIPYRQSDQLSSPFDPRGEGRTREGSERGGFTFKFGLDRLVAPSKANASSEAD
jgi:hypothetical protein